ncbi:MAG: 50S ribosomal protein L10 [Patescibacteria group bacterium]
MKTKQQKRSDLKVLEEKLPKAGITVFTTFARSGKKGLSVAQMQELKRALRAMTSEYLVTKKTLVDLALHDLKYDGADIFGMEGSMGIALGTGDPYAVAKGLYDFAKKNQALKLFGALYDGKLLSKEDFMEMALMPSREVLLGRLVGMLTYPIRGLAVSLQQIADQKGAGAPTPVPEAPATEAEQPAVVEDAATEPAAPEVQPAEEVPAQ